MFSQNFQDLNFYLAHDALLTIELYPSEPIIYEWADSKFRIISILLLFTASINHMWMTKNRNQSFKLKLFVSSPSHCF